MIFANTCGCQSQEKLAKTWTKTSLCQIKVCGYSGKRIKIWYGKTYPPAEVIIVTKILVNCCMNLISKNSKCHTAGFCLLKLRSSPKLTTS